MKLYAPDYYTKFLIKFQYLLTNLKKYCIILVEVGKTSKNTKHNSEVEKNGRIRNELKLNKRC